jgi:glycerol-3-phosphate dehydrogenase
MRPRHERLQILRNNPDVSVLIIGAGINGIGTFRDLALQGVDVVLVDRGDYCSGASAASSHMVHGGIRYLENGEFHLVREAVRERNLLLEKMPHMVKPLPTTFPIFKLFSGLFNAPLKFLGLLDKPAERGAVVIKIGMLLYDYYTRKQKTVPKHVFRNRKESLALFPALDPKVIYTGTYYDGAMHSPERIAIEVLKDAQSENERAVSINYAGMVSSHETSVTLRDDVSGEIFELRPKILINAAGPWIDLVNARMGQRTAFISGTKGSHLVVDHPKLRQAIGENEFFFENKDGRIVLIFPLLDKVMIGTSDILVDDPDDVVITEDEVRYFFDLVGRVFPHIHLQRDHIVYTFSGVRPLQHSERRDTGQISRNHKVQICEPGELLDIPVFSLVGGKWTSFRAFSELAADMALERLGAVRKISTEDLEIGGSKGIPRTAADKETYLAGLAEAYPVGQEWLVRLFERYGTKVEALLEAEGKDAGQRLATLPDVSVGELRYVLAEEDVLHLDDLILRRTMLGVLGRITPDCLREIAQLCAAVLGWSAQETEGEMRRFTEILHHNHKMDFNTYIGG